MDFSTTITGEHGISADPFCRAPRVADGVHPKLDLCYLTYGTFPIEKADFWLFEKADFDAAVLNVPLMPVTIKNSFGGCNFPSGRKPLQPP